MYVDMGSSLIMTIVMYPPQVRVPKELSESKEDLQLFLTAKVHSEINLAVLVPDLDGKGVFGHGDELVVDPALAEYPCRRRIEV